MLKRNIAPSSGYANGTRGNMTGIFYKDDTVLTTGRPGELIQIEPPQYICMQVTDNNGITAVPCKRQSDDIEFIIKVSREIIIACLAVLIWHSPSQYMKSKA